MSNNGFRRTRILPNGQVEEIVADAVQSAPIVPVQQPQAPVQQTNRSISEAWRTRTAYNNPKLGITDGVLNPNALTSNPIPSDAPNQVQGMQLTFGQRHPWLNALGGFASGFVQNAAQRNSNLGSALASGLFGGVKSAVDRNDKITQMRNDLLTKVQQAQIKNMESKRLADQLRSLGIENTGNYFIGSAEDADRVLKNVAQYGKPNDQGVFSVTPSESNTAFKQLQTKATLELTDINGKIANLRALDPNQKNPQAQDMIKQLEMRAQGIIKQGYADAKSLPSIPSVVESLKLPGGLTEQQADIAKKKADAAKTQLETQYLPREKEAEIKGREVTTQKTQVETQGQQIENLYRGTVEKAKAGDAAAKAKIQQAKLTAIDYLRSLPSNVTGQAAIDAYDAWNIINDFPGMRVTSGMSVDPNPYAAARKQALNPKPKQQVPVTPPPQPNFFQSLFPTTTPITKKPPLGQ